MSSPEELAEKHSAWNNLVFKTKSGLLIFRRSISNFLNLKIKRHKLASPWQNGLEIGDSQSQLWNPHDNSKNFILTAGKIQNLRVAASKLNGLVIPAGETFSFWKHIGKPVKRNGFVIGREIREGCIVATTGGGLCQLSNALYDAALKSGFNITERYRHSKVVKGSLAEKGRDATVKWNYIDLRFIPDQKVQIQINHDENNFSLKFVGLEKTTSNSKTKHHPSDKINDCYSCGNTRCVKHKNPKAIEESDLPVTYILDQYWPEYEAYVKSNMVDGDVVFLPVKPNRFYNPLRYRWSIKKSVAKKYSTFTYLKQSLVLRFGKKYNSKLAKTSIRFNEKITSQLLSRIPKTSKHIVISQAFLPFAIQQNLLMGRTYDVLMQQLPMHHLQQQLDQALKNNPKSTTLGDFRAQDNLVHQENIGLNQARKIITPHHQIAEIFNQKTTLLGWHLPKVSEQKKPLGEYILFPASSLGRKGAFEMKKLAQKLNLKVLVLGRAKEFDGFWEGVDMEFTDPEFWSKVNAVVYPTYIENQPRIVLKAISKNIPVYITPACGIQEGMNIHHIEIDQLSELEAKLKNFDNVPV